jgi:hypothetical protein
MKKTASKTASDLDWSSPPPPPPGQTFVNVDFRVGVEQLNDVDTVKGVANVKLGVVMYWTDTRLIGWTSKLPSNLWGPYYDSAAGGSALRSV